ncbi:unnamed protein product [Didymodactylos carnosus]|uniref:Uncharacterized protein n=1 Tax=Didymodactylos carnosus TaxID=1234261 RepID=A0A8S2DMY3_9BILA|nr:unnamed protein product [Didymodactylos carnosus]CAF3775388.1 unnamed protein product [Didymodactylos carnosus]
MKPGLLKPIKPPDPPFQMTAIDYVGPFPRTPSENRYVLVITGMFTRWVTALALPIDYDSINCVFDHRRPAEITTNAIARSIDVAEQSQTEATDPDRNRTTGTEPFNIHQDMSTEVANNVIVEPQHKQTVSSGTTNTVEQQPVIQTEQQDLSNAHSLADTQPVVSKPPTPEKTYQKHKLDRNASLTSSTSKQSLKSTKTSTTAADNDDILQWCSQQMTSSNDRRNKSLTANGSSEQSQPIPAKLKGLKKQHRVIISDAKAADQCIKKLEKEQLLVFGQYLVKYQDEKETNTQGVIKLLPEHTDNGEYHDEQAFQAILNPYEIVSSKYEETVKKIVLPPNHGLSL